MLARYVRGIKRGLKDYRWLLYYLQRELTLNPAHRKRIASLVARVLPHSCPFHPTAEARALASRLDQEGIALLPDLLSASQLRDILSYLRTKTCHDPRHPEMPGFKDPADAHSTCFHAYYSDLDVVHTPHLLALANRPSVLAAVEMVLGCKPTVASIYIWWLLASYDYTDSESEYFCSNASNLHRDVDDWAQIKMFIYLSDVDALAAPHLFLKGSHRGGIAAASRNLPLETAQRIHPEELKTITGPAGTAWLENAYGLHVGTLPRTANRLIAAIGYSLLPQPFPTARRTLSSDLDPLTYDPYVNRLWISGTRHLENHAS